MKSTPALTGVVCAALLGLGACARPATPPAPPSDAPSAAAAESAADATPAPTEAHAEAGTPSAAPESAEPATATAGPTMVSQNCTHTTVGGGFQPGFGGQPGIYTPGRDMVICTPVLAAPRPVPVARAVPVAAVPVAVAQPAAPQ